MSKSCKYAELMVMYAQDAAKTKEPWKMWEVRGSGKVKWSKLDAHPNWVQNCEYRRKANWSPVGGDWWIDGSGEVEEVDTSFGSQEFGVERPTQQQAERAAIEMRKFNRLLALRDELCGDAVVDYEKEFHEVAYNLITNQWIVHSYVTVYVSTGVHFSSASAAIKAAEMLNAGEVEL